MFCFDDLPPTMAIGGVKNSGDFHEISINFAPCNFNDKVFFASVSENCDWSREAQRNYLGSPVVGWLTNY